MFYITGVVAEIEDLFTYDDGFTIKYLLLYKKTNKKPNFIKFLFKHKSPLQELEKIKIGEKVAIEFKIIGAEKKSDRNFTDLVVSSITKNTKGLRNVGYFKYGELFSDNLTNEEDHA